MPTSIAPQRARLGRRLRELRAVAYASGSALARYLAERHPEGSWHQTRVSKLERGEQRPTAADITQWIEATGATEDEAQQLWELLAAARIEYATVGAFYEAHGGPAQYQASVAAQESTTGHIRKYQPAMMPGFIQTSAYARELLSLPTGPAYFGATPADIEEMVTQRVHRQDVLYQPNKTIQIVLGEAALHTRPGKVDTLAGQLDRLVTIAGLVSVELGIVPFGTPTPVIPLTGFTVHDDVVLIETLAGEQRLDDGTDVALYLRAFDQLREAAVTGADATALIQRASAALRD